MNRKQTEIIELPFGLKVTSNSISFYVENTNIDYLKARQLIYLYDCGAIGRNGSAKLYQEIQDFLVRE